MSIGAARNTRGEEAMAQKRGWQITNSRDPNFSGRRGRRARARGHSLVGEERSSHVDGLYVAYGSRIGIGSSDRACSGAVRGALQVVAGGPDIGLSVGFGFRISVEWFLPRTGR